MRFWDIDRFDDLEMRPVIKSIPKFPLFFLFLFWISSSFHRSSFFLLLRYFVWTGRWTARSQGSPSLIPAIPNQILLDLGCDGSVEAENSGRSAVETRKSRAHTWEAFFVPCKFHGLSDYASWDRLGLDPGDHSHLFWRVCARRFTKSGEARDVRCCKPKSYMSQCTYRLHFHNDA